MGLETEDSREAPQSEPSSGPSSGHSHIREVWAYNLEEEMDTIRDIAESYPYIAMDTEFPGVVARPVGPFKDGPDYNYQRIKCNVDLLKVIQIGLTFMDPNGRLPTEDGHPYNTWQFNFRFDLNFDLYAADSVQFLQGCGLDFERHNREGIEATLFGELLMSSGIVLSEEVRWIAFQGKYDFGYLIKLLTCDQLPSSQEQFFDLLHTYFPNIYDIKWLLHNVHHELEDRVNAQAAVTTSPSTADSGAAGLPRGQKDKGLEDLAKTLEIPRMGTAHQAGSDSLLTAEVFFRLVHRHLPHVLSAPGGSETTATSGPGSPLKSPAHPRHHSEPPGSRGRSASVGSDSLIIEGRPCHLRNVLHGLGRGYIQPDRDHSQLSAAAQSRAALAASPPPGATPTFLRHSPFSPMPPPQISAGRQAVAPPPLSGAIRFDGSTPTTIVQE